jgi:hypothetical protein
LVIGFLQNSKNQHVRTALAAISLLLSLMLAKAQGEDASQQIVVVDPVINFDSIRIFSYKLSSDKRLISEIVQKANPNQNLADLLQKQSGVFIRSNGNAGLSTPSYKGLGTMQTPITMNGANMQSSMNGTMDLSLIDATHFNNLTIDTDAKALGMSNMGQTISLTSGLSEPELNASLAYSTQQEKTLALKFGNTVGRFVYKISGIASTSPNITSLKPYGIDSNQANTDFKKVSVAQTIYYTTSKQGVYRNMVYVQAADRAIPQKIGELANSRQQDQNLMMLNAFTQPVKKNIFLKVQNQVWREQIVFEDAKAKDTTASNVLNINSRLSLTTYIEKLKIVAAIAHDGADYSSEALLQNATWSRWKPSFSLERSMKKGMVVYEQENVLYEGKWRGNYKASVNYVLGTKYRLELAGNRVYRLPVLNELFWYQPGLALGRADLKPEDGTRIDMVLKRQGKNVQINVNPHWGSYSNWIQWSGFPVIRPENVNNVRVLGAIVEASHTQIFKSLRLVTQANFHWVRAHYIFEDNDARDDKQLIYTPQFTGNLTLTLVGARFAIYSNTQFVGTNYYTSDNSSKLDPYALLEFGGYYEINKWRLGGVMSNVQNTPYYTQPRTPLPGQVFKININYTIPLKPWKEKL